MTTKNFLFKHRAEGSLIVLALGGALAFGCSSDSNSRPTTPVIIGGDAGPDSGPSGTGGSSAGGAGGSAAGGSGTGAKSGAGGSGAGGTSGTGGDGGPGGTTDGGDGGSKPPVCDPTPGANGCYPCPPTTPDQFQNQCSVNGVQCQKYDNATVLGAAFTNFPIALPN